MTKPTDPRRSGLFALLGALAGSGCQGTRPSDLGPKDGLLRPCPDSPNCVSSKAADDGHHVAPLVVTGDPETAIARLAQLVRAMDRAVVVTESKDYLHAEFTSRLLRFVDDVEFLLDRKAGTVEVRSASRLGRSDFGVNRERVEAIRAAFAAPAS